MWITAKISIQRFVKHISPCIHLHIVKSNRTNNKNPNSQDRIGFKQKKKIITYSSTISKGFPFELHASFHSIIFYKYKKVLISPFNLRLTKLLTESKCANMYFSWQDRLEETSTPPKLYAAQRWQSPLQFEHGTLLSKRESFILARKKSGTRRSRFSIPVSSATNWIWFLRHVNLSMVVLGETPSSWRWRSDWTGTRSCRTNTTDSWMVLFLFFLPTTT